jgi:CRISPR-associated protein Csb1
MQLSLEQLKNLHRTKTTLLEKTTNYKPIGKSWPSLYTDGKGATYVREHRIDPETDSVETHVLFDSIASQANRMELAVQEAVDLKLFPYPELKIIFSNYEFDVHTEAAHRIADAMVRNADIEENGKTLPVHLSVWGKDFIRTNPNKDGTLIYKYDPLALIMGYWAQAWRLASGPKLARCLQAELLGIEAPNTKCLSVSSKMASKINLKAACEMDTEGSYKFTRELEKISDAETDSDKAEKTMANVGLGQIVPSVKELGGVSLVRAYRQLKLNLVGLRNLRFGSNPEKNLSMQTSLTVLAIVASELLEQEAPRPRSGCDLVMDKKRPSTWKIWKADGGVDILEVTLDSALEVLNQAVQEIATKYGIDWGTTKLHLKGSKFLEDVFDPTGERISQKGKSSKKKPGKNNLPASTEEEPKIFAPTENPVQTEEDFLQ